MKMIFKTNPFMFKEKKPFSKTKLEFCYFGFGFYL